MTNSNSSPTVDVFPKASAGTMDSFWEDYTMHVIQNDNPSSRFSSTSEPVEDAGDRTSADYWASQDYRTRKYAAEETYDPAVLDAIIKAELASGSILTNTITNAVWNECVSEGTLAVIREAMPDFGVDELLASIREEEAQWEAERIERELTDSYCPQLPPKPMLVIEVDPETNAVIGSFLEDPNGNVVDDLVTPSGTWRIVGDNLRFMPAEGFVGCSELIRVFRPVTNS